MWSATAAAQLRLPYVFAHFINPEPTRAAIEYYHSHVTASGVSVPQTILALGVICADTEAEAQRLNASMRLRRVIRELRADPGQIPTPEEALARLGPGPEEAAPDEGEWARYIVGAPEQVHAKLVRMAKELRVEELMVVIVVHDHEAATCAFERDRGAHICPRCRGCQKPARNRGVSAYGSTLITRRSAGGHAPPRRGGVRIWLQVPNGRAVVVPPT
jgi:alkanesulfonate monooxygenase SsuD/methylene tetrahydromethanopterin reductase-like flavin-dependent oxidoreductase (luciferase family)